jgi:hypothetical protein
MLGAWNLSRTGTLVVVLTLAALSAVATPTEPTVDDLKARLATSSVGDRPHLCVEIAQKQLSTADKLYAAGDVDKGQAALADVVTYSESARDNAIQSHKYQKQSEIAVRAMTRKLTELLHSLGRDEQAPVQDAVRRLQQVRDDLLKAMFPKGAK